MFYKVKKVKPLENYELLVNFVIGVTKKYKVKPLIKKYDMFKKLEDISLFNKVYTDKSGYAVMWTEDIDISCNELWNNGELVNTPFDNLISFKDATDLWGLNESTLRKNISYGRLKEGTDVMKFGKQWIITKEAMIRLYGKVKTELPK
jgi:hypothetical protein